MNQSDQLIKELQDALADFSAEHLQSDKGTVLSVSDAVVTIAGLPHTKMSEVLNVMTESGPVPVLALNLEEGTIGAVILGDTTRVAMGQAVHSTGEVLSVMVNDEVIGKVVNPLVKPVDGSTMSAQGTRCPIERLSPGVMARQSVDQPLETGIVAIDALVPIGRGQRELIIGDRQTGKTTVAIDAIVNQKGKGIMCVYVAIGQKESRVARVVEELKRTGAMEYTTVVMAGASDNPALLYLAPYAGVTIAEYFMDKGQDVLIVYDDLSKHAASYREISLLLRRPPGREAYPGDVFYLHSRLLERACRRNAEHGGGSITALPIIETQAGDVSAYIPTNVISITDGQIFLESGLFNKGVRPAINVGLSVSRVGGSAQTKSMKKNAGPLKLALAQYRELESFAQFDSDLDPATKSSLERGKRLVELLKQAPSHPLQTNLQVVSLYAASKGYLDSVAVVDVKTFEQKLHSYMSTHAQSALEMISKGWNDETEDALKTALSMFVAEYAN
jgi:F-type H+-transporting ATPase subunit alpha